MMNNEPQEDNKKIARFVKESLDNTEGILARYRMTIGVLVLVMLITLIISTWIFFDKQNQIIETGGFVDGKIKCVCNQEAWDQFNSGVEGIIELEPYGIETPSNNISNGQE